MEMKRAVCVWEQLVNNFFHIAAAAAREELQLKTSMRHYPMSTGSSHVYSIYHYRRTSST